MAIRKQGPGDRNPDREKAKQFLLDPNTQWNPVTSPRKETGAGVTVEVIEVWNSGKAPPPAPYVMAEANYVSEDFVKALRDMFRKHLLVGVDAPAIHTEKTVIYDEMPPVPTEKWDYAHVFVTMTPKAKELLTQQLSQDKGKGGSSFGGRLSGR